jgi:dihydrofolate reductase
MRTCILYIAHSLDGFIAGPDGDLSWLPPPRKEEDYGYHEFIAEVDTVLMGRVTYDFVLQHPPYHYPGTTGFVWSRARAGERDDNVTFTAENPVALVSRLQTEPGRSIWVVGGTAVIHPLMQADLIDEYWLFVVPVVLGHGVPLWPARGRPLRLRPRDVLAYPDGLVRLRYFGGSR